MSPDDFLICPECRYRVALVHNRQFVEVECPGCGSSIAGDALVEVVITERPPTAEDIDRWIASHRSKRPSSGDDPERR